VVDPAVAVIVIVVPDVTPTADNVAVMVPFALVEALAPVRVPALAANVTGTPLTALLLASFASTVIVAVLLPSTGIEATLLDTVNEAAFEPAVATVTVPLPNAEPAEADTVIVVPPATPDAVTASVT
jgi:hypothetical protein